MTEPYDSGMNRRFKLGLLWAALININYYIVFFGGKTLDWWTEYAKSMTFWFGIIVGALTLTDIASRIKDVFAAKNGGEAK